MRIQRVIPRTPVGFAIALAVAALIALGVSTVLAPWRYGVIVALIVGIATGAYVAMVLERPYLRARAIAGRDGLMSDPHVAQLSALILGLNDTQLATAQERAVADLETRQGAWSRVSLAALEAGQYARLEEAQSAGAEGSPGTAVLSEAAGWAMGAVAVRTAADEGDILLLVAPFARLR